MRKLLTLLLLPTLAACGIIGGGGGRPPDPPKPPNVATFAAVATDGTTGAPIEGAVIDVQATPETDDGHTNADGYVTVTIPKFIEFAVELHAEGYEPYFGTVRLEANEQRHIVLTSTGGGAPWQGRLSVRGRCYVDETGACQLPVFAHFGEAFSAWVHGKPEQVTQQMRVIKAAGYDGVRFWDTLGYYQVWRDKVVMPWSFTNREGQTVEGTPGYYEALREFLAMLNKVGLTAHHSRGDLNGQSSRRVSEHAGTVANLYDGVGWSTLALAEGNNEDWQNGDFGPSGLRSIVSPFKQRGAITALSCPPDSSEEPTDILRYSSDVFYVHGLRTGQPADRLRHIFSLAREPASGTPALGWQGEPTGPGPGVTVGRVDDPEELAWLAAMSLMARQSWVYMSSHGVFWNGPIESQPGFYAVPRVRAALKAFAPDLMSWSLTHGNTGDSKFRSPNGYFGDRCSANCPARIDQTYTGDGRIVALIYGGSGSKSVRNDSGKTLDVEVLSIGDDEQVNTYSTQMNAGDVLTLDYRVGRLLLARPVS